jgi:nicotinamidase-related amidase
MKRRRMSNSPLMDPLVCALAVVAPHPQELEAHEPGISNHQRTLGAVTQAAHIANVPVFSLCSAEHENKKALWARLPMTSSHRQFVLEEHCSPWSHRGFVDALAGEDRSILILAGYWLELQILATALHALAEGYDVCVLLDATLTRCPHASQPARERLSQAGATPVVTSQVIHEWTLEAPDTAKREALDSLLAALMAPETA